MIVKDTHKAQMLARKYAFKLELKGLKLSGGRSVHAIVKQQYGLKGNRQSVYDQYCRIVERDVFGDGVGDEMSPQQRGAITKRERRIKEVEALEEDRDGLLAVLDERNEHISRLESEVSND